MGESVEVPLRRRDGTIRAVALVDAEDAERVLAKRWCWHSKGYAARRTPDGLMLLHRELLGLAIGDPMHVDHRDGNRLNCRRSNIRVVTQAQNNQNLPAQSGSTSRHRGVSFCRQTGRWRAVVGCEGRFHHLGRFDTEDEAAAVAAAFRRARMPFSVER